MNISRETIHEVLYVPISNYLVINNEIYLTSYFANRIYPPGSAASCRFFVNFALEILHSTRLN